MVWELARSVDKGRQQEAAGRVILVSSFLSCEGGADPQEQLFFCSSLISSNPDQMCPVVTLLNPPGLIRSSETHLPLTFQRDSRIAALISVSCFYKKQSDWHLLEGGEGKQPAALAVPYLSLQVCHIDVSNNTPPPPLGPGAAVMTIITVITAISLANIIP